MSIKKIAVTALAAVTLIGIGTSASADITVSEAGGTFNFGVNTIAYVWYQQYANYSHSGWHHATAMMNGDYVSSRTYDGNARASTPWYTSYSTNNSYWGLG